MLMVEQRDRLLLTPVKGCPVRIGVWLAAIQDARRRTLEVLENIDPLWLSFIPPEGGESIGTILYHLAAIEADWLYAEVLQESFPLDVEKLLPYDVRDGESNLTVVFDTLDNHLERLKIIREKLLNSYLGMTVDEFERPHALPQYDVSPAWVLHHLMQHEAEHRSQINAIGMQAKVAFGG